MKLDLRTLHRMVVHGGNTEVEQAVGLIEKALIEHPGNPRARIHKGSLLTLLGEGILGAEKNKVYAKTGLSMMKSVLDETAATAPDRTEFEYLYATTIASLKSRRAQSDEAGDLLAQLIMRSEFSSLTEFEQVRSLVLFSGICKRKGWDNLAKTVFQRASAIDRVLASDIYAQSLERLVE